MNEVLTVEGGVCLQGEVVISSSKNSVLPIMAATLLTDEEVTLQQVPRLSDVQMMIDLLESAGECIRWAGADLVLSCSNGCRPEPSEEAARTMRASFLVMGPMLARWGRAKVALPGGCDIGERPVDLHLKGLSALGARIAVRHGCVDARCEKLSGATIYLDFPSVGCTENLIMAASLAQGETLLINAAREPEIVDLAGMINSMGGRITGAGTDTVRIVGVPGLCGTTWHPIADRIEAGTFLLAAGATRGRVTVQSVQPLHLRPVIAKLIEAGLDVTQEHDYVRVESSGRCRAVDIHTMPWPGFPTDLQAPMMVMDALARGESVITETIFENRFKHVAELTRMGADIKVKGRSAFISGVNRLSGASLVATDLRAGVALVIAALCATGKSHIADAQLINRGYDHFIDKIRGLGANVSLEKE